MRVRETFDHYLVAVCDKSLLGKTLIQGNLVFRVSEEFYGGELVDIETCMTHLKRATIVNMVGKTTVTAAINRGLISKEAVLYIDGEPHAQWVRL